MHPHPHGRETRGQSPTLRQSAIHVLPDDVLYIIFLTAHTSNPRNFPIVVSHVCSGWRELALGAGALWGAIIFDDAPTNLEKNTTWIQRSGEALLDIDIRNGSYYDTSGAMDGVLRLIVPVAARWRSLQVPMNDDLSLEVHGMLFDQLRDVAAPRLEVLRAGTTAYPLSSRWTLRPFQSHGAPNLQRLSVRRVGFDWKNSTLLRNLVYLWVDDSISWTNTSFLHVLRQTPLLNTLLVFDTGNTDNEAPILTSSPSPALSHNQLTSLTISPKAFMTLLLSIRLINLEHLRLWGEISTAQLSHTFPFHHHLPKLRRISIREVAVEREDRSMVVTNLLSTFSKMTTVTVIALQWMTFEFDVRFNRLLEIAPPNTDTLCFEDVYFPNVGASLREMVESRMQVEGATRLRRLEMNHRGIYRFIAEEEFQWLVENVPEVLIRGIGGPWTQE